MKKITNKDLLKKSGGTIRNLIGRTIQLIDVVINRVRELNQRQGNNNANQFDLVALIDNNGLISEINTNFIIANERLINEGRNDPNPTLPDHIVIEDFDEKLNSINRILINVIDRFFEGDERIINMLKDDLRFFIRNIRENYNRINQHVLQ